LDEAENLSYEDGGITEQTGMAERGLEVFHAGFTNLDPGWQGSVTKQRPNHPIPDGRGPKSVKTPVRIFAKEQYSIAHANETSRAPKTYAPPQAGNLRERWSLAVVLLGLRLSISILLGILGQEISADAGFVLVQCPS